MSYRKPPLKIAVVDDHNLFRKGLITLVKLADDRNYLVVLEAENGKDMIRKLDKKALPDILMLDIDMPEMDGYETMAWLKDHFPSVSVLVVSMVDNEEAIVRMMRLGVKGYLSKDIEVEDVHQALQSISAKGYYYTDFITGKLIDSIKHERGESKALSEQIVLNQLSENELKFVKLACSEMTYEQIAEKMFLSPKTIDGYRSAVFSRFNIKNRPGLILFALKNKLFSVDEID